MVPLHSGRRATHGAAEGGAGAVASAYAQAAEDPVNILRFLDPNCIALDLQSPISPAPDAEESAAARERRLVSDKETLLQELCELLDRSGAIVNPSKFYKDMVNRERKATTAIAPGIAIPHVRSMQVRSFVMGFARSRQGHPFASLDGGPTRLFFLLASPPYEDKLYLRVYRQFAEMIRHDWVQQSFLDAETEQDVLNILRGYVSQ